MDYRALPKVRSRLRVATEAAAKLGGAKTYDDFYDAWSAFLHAAKGIYTILEQGAKASAQSRQWFGAKNQFRKDDELLRYITEARNDDEHGLNEMGIVAPPVLIAGINAPGASRIVRDAFGNIAINSGGAAFHVTGPGAANYAVHSLDGKPVKSKFLPERVVLKPVTDRSGRVYDPPRTHLGTPLETISPAEVANLAIRYLSSLIDEADGSSKP